MAYEIMDVKDWDYSGGLVVGPGYIESGGVVRAVQQLMWAMGHATGAFDGEYGPNTESAIKAYQASVGISQDGSLDRKHGVSCGPTCR
jgi:peptidoglycan hydrolase-like protein with peptidoglycan-binding domain